MVGVGSKPRGGLGLREETDDDEEDDDDEDDDDEEKEAKGRLSVERVLSSESCG